MRGRTPCHVESEQTVDVDGVEYCVCYRASGSGYYEPESRRGHPDNWSPAEGEMDIGAVEITSITDENGEVQDMEKRQMVRAGLDEEKMQEELWEAFHGQEREPQEPPDWLIEESLERSRGRS